MRTVLKMFKQIMICKSDRLFVRCMTHLIVTLNFLQSLGDAAFRQNSLTTC